MIGLLVRETILMARVFRCAHTWTKHSEAEDQCSKCGVLATPEGKAELERRQNAPR